MRVLIVGCGYVGLPLATDMVRLGHEVFGLRRSAALKLQSSGITPLTADITRPETLTTLPRNFDWVVNCVSTGGGDAEDYRRLYLDGTRNLIEWLADSLPRKFVYTSSTGVYGQNDGSLVDENSPTEPATETSKVLVEAEKLLLEAAQQGGASVLASHNEGAGHGSRGRSPHLFPAVIVRAAGIYGPGRGYLLKQFLRGEARIEGDGGRILNMIHRDDLIGAIIAALERGQPGTIYNAVDDEPVRQLDFFKWLSDKLGKPIPPSVPANTDTNRKRGLTNKKVSNRKLKMELGYQFKYPNSREGITCCSH